MSRQITAVAQARGCLYVAGEREARPKPNSEGRPMRKLILMALAAIGTMLAVPEFASAAPLW